MYKIKLRTKTTLDLRSKTKREKTKRRGCCPTKGILTVHFIHEVLRTKAWDKEHTDKRHTLNTWQMISIYTLVPQMIENRWTGQHGYYFYLFLIDQNPSFFFMFICKKNKVYCNQTLVYSSHLHRKVFVGCYCLFGSMIFSETFKEDIQKLATSCER